MTSEPAAGEPPDGGGLATGSAPGVPAGVDRDPVRVGWWEWPDFDPVDGQGPRVWDRARAVLFVLFLVPDLLTALRQGDRPAGPLIAVSVLYGGLFAAMWVRVHRLTRTARVTGSVLLYALGLTYLAVFGPTTAPAVLGFAVSTAVLTLPLALGGAAAALTAVGVLVGSGVARGQLDWRSALILTLIGVFTTSITGTIRLVGKLRAAQAEIRVLAVAGERVRLARDLHDVLGHSLTTITIKAGLARRLLENHAPAERVLAEIRDTEELSRRALADIRATVAGQRRASLAAELVSARAALRAAGISAELPRSGDDVAGEAEEPLAWVLREGVTNVVRHSGARRCTVRLGARWLEVDDDGAGPGGAPAGTGLTGLTERLAAAGGTLTGGPGPRGGYRLRAELPAPPAVAP